MARGKARKRCPVSGQKKLATEKVVESADPDACVFCGSSESSGDNGNTGVLIKSPENFSVHYFCMLFASGLYQRGNVEDDRDGMKGFLKDDIFKERRRALKLRCTFCKEPGAPTGCIEKKCNTKYHFGCGRKNGVLFQFFGSFCSFCEEHRPFQELNRRRRRFRFVGTARTQCAICMRPLATRTSTNTLGTPCCKKFFHRECMQQMGTSSGYVHFKCPTCNNVEEFRKEMLKFGIYLPDQDAAWELEPNAFTELHEMYSHCDAEVCLNPDGRRHFIDQANRHGKTESLMGLKKSLDKKI